MMIMLIYREVWVLQVIEEHILIVFGLKEDYLKLKGSSFIMVMQVVHRTSIVDLIMPELMVMTPFNFLVIAVNMICD